MVRGRLAVKISILIVVVLIIGFGVSTILTVQREADLLVEQSKVSARRLTATLVASIEGAMLQERPDVTRTVLQELKTSTPVEGLSIFRRNGVEAFTDMTTAMEVDKNAGLAKDVLDNIKRMARAPGQAASGPQFLRAVESLKTQESLEMRDGATFFTLHHPILNQEKCQGCHGSDHKVRAVVRVDTSMAPVFAEVRHHRNRQFLIGGLTIVAAAAVLTVAMRRVVVRPITQLSERGAPGRRRRLRRAGAGHQPRRDRRARRRLQRDDGTAVHRPSRAGGQEHRAGHRAAAPAGVARAAGAAGAAQGRAVEVRAGGGAAPARAEPQRHRAGEEDGRGLGTVPGHRRLHEAVRAARAAQAEPARADLLLRASSRSSSASTATSTRRPATA